MGFALIIKCMLPHCCTVHIGFCCLLVGGCSTVFLLSWQFPLSDWFVLRYMCWGVKVNHQSPSPCGAWHEGESRAVTAQMHLGFLWYQRGHHRRAMARSSPYFHSRKICSPYLGSTFLSISVRVFLHPDALVTFSEYLVIREYQSRKGSACTSFHMLQMGKRRHAEVSDQRCHWPWIHCSWINHPLKFLSLSFWPWGFGLLCFPLSLGQILN